MPADGTENTPLTTVSRATVIKSYHGIYFQQNPIPKKYHFPKTVNLLEQKRLQGMILPGLAEALQMTRSLSEPQGPCSHHFVLVRSGPISSLDSLASAAGTRSWGAVRTFLPLLALIVPLPTFPPSRIGGGGVWEVEKNVWRWDKRELVILQVRICSMVKIHLSSHFFIYITN